MRKFTVLAISILVFSAIASAQMEQKPLVVPNTEIFFGYAFQRADTAGSNEILNLVNVNSTTLNGIAFELSHYFHGNLGVTIDVAHGWNNAVDPTGIKYKRTNYLAGPSYRLHRWAFLTPSVHALAGVDHDDFTIPTSATTYDQTDVGFAALAGATFDGNLSSHLAVRLAQVDYLYTHHYGTSQSSFRYAGGVVVRF